jgi:hypothetical protein
MRPLRTGCVVLALVAASMIADTPSGFAAEDDSPSLLPVDQAGIAIKALGETSGFQDVYAEVVVDEQSGRVRLDVTSPGSDSDTLAAAAGGLAPVDVRVVANSFAAQMTLLNSVVAEIPLWAEQGVTITKVGPDAETSLVDIGLADPDPASTLLLLNRYGATKVRVSQYGGTDETASRTADTSPYNGGIVIRNSAGGGTCTAGFGVHSGSTAKASSTTMITAGHCYTNGAAVYHNGVKVGTVTRSSTIYAANGMDIETVSISSSRYVWETNTARARSDGSVTSLPVGVSVCHSGAATDKRCGTTVAVNQCVPVGATTFCHQTSVRSTGLLIAEGDSGGPWFTTVTISGIKYFSAVGIQSGGRTSTQYFCTTQLGANQRCYTEGTYTEFLPIFNTTNLWPNY